MSESGGRCLSNPKIIIIIIIKTIKTKLYILEDNITPFLDTVNGLQLWKTHVIMFLNYCIMLGFYMANWNWVLWICFIIIQWRSKVPKSGGGGGGGGTQTRDFCTFGKEPI